MESQTKMTQDTLALPASIEERWTDVDPELKSLPSSYRRKSPRRPTLDELDGDGDGPRGMSVRPEAACDARSIEDKLIELIDAKEPFEEHYLLPSDARWRGNV